MKLWLSLSLLLFVQLPAVNIADELVAKVSRQIHSFSGDELQSSADIVHRLIDTGYLSELHWPDISAYRSELINFYASSNYSLAWIRDNQPTVQAREMISLLESAGKKGLRAEDYDAVYWQRRIAILSLPVAKVREGFDVALTVSTMRYLYDLHNGRLPPPPFRSATEGDKSSLDLAEFLRTRIVNGEDIAKTVEEVEPPFTGYRRTKSALEHYLSLEREGEGDPLPAITEPLNPGDAYAGVAQLIARLQRLGDFSGNPEALPVSNIYEGTVVEAVRHFQQRHGLFPDGRIDKDTFEELVAPLHHRVVQLELALERWRWLPADLKPPLIVVNIPEFHLRAYDEHKLSLSTRVITGKAFGHQTPVFADELEYVIFRPYWNVPNSILQQELIPKLEEDRAYLTKYHFEVVKKGAVITDGTVNDAILERLRAGELGIRQTPGPSNALGLIKFVFPNSYDVYLHATPEQELFERSRRDFSHGCIRVEDPVALATWLLRDDPSWTKERIIAAMNGSETMRVNLPHKIPVLIVYGTAFVEENGEARFYRDIYRHDAALEHALEVQYPYPH
ncbi:MAG TPA: L,D-transpeptidase family protein [Terriglobales bacterium]